MSSPFEIVSATKFRYQRLKREDLLGDGEDKGRLIVRSWHKLRRFHPRKRFKVKVPSLRRLLRRKVKVVYGAYAKVLKRFKESQAHFGDLFAGNYLFLQVNPTSFEYLKKSKSHPNINAFPSRYPLPRIY